MKTPWSTQSKSKQYYSPDSGEPTFEVRHIDVLDSTGRLLAFVHGDIGDGDGTAAHIVKCVNMHDKLAGAVQYALSEFNPRECSCDGTPGDEFTCYYHRIERELNNSVAKAGGE